MNVGENHTLWLPLLLALVYLEAASLERGPVEHHVFFSVLFSAELKFLATKAYMVLKDS